MRFLMVDTICSLEEEKQIRGIKNVSWDEDFLQEFFQDVPVFSPVIATEAAAQLVSWLIIKSRDFTVKPVITVVDSYVCRGHALPGDQLELQGEVESFSEESALCNARIINNGKTIIEMSHAVCYLYPLEELDPPEAARRQFANLYREGHPLSAPRAHTREDLMREKVQLTPRPWIDRITGDDPGHLAGIKNVTATEAFFNDHFPRKSVLPGVVTLECLIGLAARLAERELEAKGLSRLRPVLQRTAKIKFRMFLQPGDQLVMDARLTEFSESSSTIKVAGQVGGKRAAMITVHFTHLDRDSYLEQFIF